MDALSSLHTVPYRLHHGGEGFGGLEGTAGLHHGCPLLLHLQLLEPQHPTLEIGKVSFICGPLLHSTVMTFGP
jgi:hypothetical protein